MIGLAILLIVATTEADPKLHPYTPTAETSNEVHYHYRYAVDDPKSGVINDRWEHRYGEYVKGAYSVLDPDGRVRTVDYEVDGPKGFHAVIRTQYPGNSLLSYVQLQKSFKEHGDPPVNILTNQKIETASSVFNNQRSTKLHKDLPVNFHSISPNYYLSLIPGQRTKYPSSQRNFTSGAFVAASPDKEEVREQSMHQNNERQDIGAAPQRNNRFSPPSQFMLPPPVGPSVYDQFTQAIPVTPATSVDFSRTYYSGG